MVKVTQKDGGFVIAGKVLYGATVPSEKYINLAQEKGDVSFYEKIPFQSINCPGEYDIEEIFIKSILGRGNKLNFIVKINDTRIAIIQTTDVLDRDDIGDMNVWIYSDDKIAEKIDQMELEGQKVKLEE